MKTVAFWCGLFDALSLTYDRQNDCASRRNRIFLSQKMPVHRIFKRQTTREKQTVAKNIEKLGPSHYVPAKTT